MDLPIFKKQSEPSAEHLWSLAIGKNWVDSAIWKVEQEKVHIVAHGGPFPYQEGDIKSLVEAADGSLSNAAAKIKVEIKEPSKVVFGLPPAYLENGEIKKECVEILKKLSHELELSPAGFVVIPEAIIHFVKAQEGAPPNAILVGTSEETLEVTLIQNGKIIKTTEVGRSISVGGDIAEGLARIGEPSQYPTRILIYNHKAADLEATKHELLDTDWEKIGITFLHTPKVEVLPEDAVISSVSLAGGAEVGGATALAYTAPKTQNSSIMSVEESLGEESEVLPEEEITTQDLSNIKTVSPEELGFIEGEDIKDSAVAATPIPEPQITPTFAVHSPATTAIREPDAVNILSTFIKKAKGFGGGRKKYTLASGLILTPLSFGLFYWYAPSAHVSIFVAPKNIEETIEFKTTTSSSPDIGSKTIPAKFIEIEKSTTKQKNATGVKKIGDKAKGEVVIYRVGPAVTLPKGTVLSSGSLKFTLDKDIKIASGSAGPDTLGKNTEAAGVTAVSIGTEYNLSSSSSFKIGTFSAESTTAKNDKAFTGGNAREVPAVSGEDLESLEADAKKELEEKAAAEIKGKLSDGDLLIPDKEKLEITKKDFSDTSGQEVQTVSLNLTGKVRFLVVSREHIKDLTIAQSPLPEGFTLRAENLSIEPEAKGKNSIFKARVKASLLPQVKPEDIIEKIAGSAPQKARSILSATPGFTRAEIATKFKFPGPLGTLPHIKRKITLEVVAEQ